jgi:hypothetical protein
VKGRKKDQEDDYKKGLTFEKIPKLLTRGHQHFNPVLTNTSFNLTFSSCQSCPIEFSGMMSRRHVASSFEELSFSQSNLITQLKKTFL